jgi:hypothetical protein
MPWHLWLNSLLIFGQMCLYIEVYRVFAGVEFPKNILLDSIEIFEESFWFKDLLSFKRCVYMSSKLTGFFDWRIIYLAAIWMRICRMKIRFSISFRMERTYSLESFAFFCFFERYKKLIRTPVMVASWIIFLII